MGMLKNCLTCINLHRSSQDYPCADCVTDHWSAPSKWEGGFFAPDDTVKVVRCKDCQNHLPSDMQNRVWCKRMCRYMMEDGFCSEGGLDGTT